MNDSGTVLVAGGTEKVHKPFNVIYVVGWSIRCIFVVDRRRLLHDTSSSSLTLYLCVFSELALAKKNVVFR